MRQLLEVAFLVGIGCLVGPGCASERARPEVAKVDCSRDAHCSEKKLCVKQRCVVVDAAEAQAACSEPQMVSFASSSDQFTTADQPALDRLVRCLKGDGHLRVRITGTADSRGTRQENLALAGARSMAVAEYLKTRGVSTAQLRLADYGEDKPVCPTTDQDCLARNRRALLDVERLPHM
jgi:outer membrane protein OmpA-like peptidoglycan-associated protein